MTVLISGASHTGKTLLAQRLTERHGCNCKLHETPVLIIMDT